MSLMGMKQRIQKFAVPVMALIGLSMLGSSVYMGLGRNAMSRQSAEDRAAAIAETPVAKVGDTNISRRTLDKIIDRQLAMFGAGMKPPANAMDSYRLQALESLKRQQAMIEVAKKEGINPSDDEIKKGIDAAWNEQGRPSFAQQLGLPPTATDREINEALAKQDPNITVETLKTQIDPEAIRNKLYQDGLTAALKKKMVVSDSTLKAKLERYKVRHILVKWDAKTTEAAAKTKAEALLAEVKANPTKMPELATKNSDDPGSKDKGGLYEWKKEDLQGLVPEFKTAVEKLKPGETYPSIVRHSGGYTGFHIIRLEGVGAPDDFEKNKAKYTDEYLQGEVNNKLMDAVKAAEPSVKIELVDPGLRAEKLIQDGSAQGKTDNKKLEEALTELDKIKSDDDPYGVLPLRKGMILERLKRDADAAKAYEEAITKNGDKPETRFTLARLYIRTKDKTKATEQLAAAEKLVLPDPQLWMQLSDLYAQLGDKAGQRRSLEKNQELTRRRQQIQQQEAQRQKDALKLAATPPPSPKK